MKANSVRGREEKWPKKENIGFLRIGTRQSCSWRETQKCKRILEKYGKSKIGKYTKFHLEREGVVRREE